MLGMRPDIDAEKRRPFQSPILLHGGMSRFQPQTLYHSVNKSCASCGTLSLDSLVNGFNRIGLTSFGEFGK